ncbi:MAG: 50S ribosomal protein L13 [Patescibacteria group bacterium]
MERQTHTIDATDKSPGRLASKIAVLLRGKNKPDFEKHKDMGDEVFVENVDKMKLTGKKVEQKKYYSHSGYPGGLKEKSMEELMEDHPDEVLRRAVFGMLPKNKLRAKQIKRLKFN